MEQLILNTSSSIYFVRLGLLQHLLKQWKMFTSEEIYAEIKDGEHIGYRDAQLLMHYFDDHKIEVRKAKKTKEFVKNFRLKEPDASVIALAQEYGGFLATEDRQIEKVCLLTQTNVINTAVLLYFLWQRKEFDNARVFLLLDLLVKQGYNKAICLNIKERILRGE